MNATEKFSGLTLLGRSTIDGVDYVCYDDGAYRHVVYAKCFDTVDEALPDDADGYTHWCIHDSDGPDDKTARQVGNDIGLTHVHSIDGVCTLIKCDDYEER